MTTQDAAVRRVSLQVGSGADVLVEGGREAVRALLADAEAALAATCNVVRVTAPAGGLNLSGLMAQLSGRADFDSQDDAVLELGFRRLAMPEDGRPTALLLDGTAGLARPVLRYLQHVGRGASGLNYVIAGGADLPALLDEAGFSPLRKRLTAQPPIAAGTADARPAAVPATTVAVPDAAVVAAVAALAAGNTVLTPAETGAAALERRDIRPTVVGMRLARLSEPLPRARISRRAWPWAAVGVGMAASLGLGAWLGHTPAADPASSVAVRNAESLPIGSGARTRAGASISAVAAVPIEPAVASVPLLAHAAPAELATAAGSPRMAALAVPPDPAKFAKAALAVVPPPLAPHVAAAPAVAMVELVPPGFEYFEPKGPASTGSLSATAQAALAVPVTAAPVTAAPGTAAPGTAGTASPQAGRTTVARARPPAAERVARSQVARHWDSAATAERRLRWGQLDDQPLSDDRQSDDRQYDRQFEARQFEGRQFEGRQFEGRQFEGRPSDARQPEAARYEWDYAQRNAVPDSPARWGGARYAPPSDGPYLGTYVPGPSGTRVFRYEQP